MAPVLHLRTPCGGKLPPDAGVWTLATSLLPQHVAPRCCDCPARLVARNAPMSVALHLPEPGARDDGCHPCACLHLPELERFEAASVGPEVPGPSWRYLFAVLVVSFDISAGSTMTTDGRAEAAALVVYGLESGGRYSISLLRIPPSCAVQMAISAAVTFFSRF